MNLGDSTIMQFMGAQLRYQSQRQVMISQNIANIDTPGYKAQEVRPVDFDDLVTRHATRIEMRATSPSHQSGTEIFSGPYRTQKDRITYETTPEGNSVSLEEQMKRLSQNTTQNELTVNLMRKFNAMYRTAGTPQQ
jgi:flagellar basal-body rod protein FlgB